jgi:hypothetical protein
MTALASLASKIYSVREIHELVGFAYWFATGKFLG